MNLTAFVSWFNAAVTFGTVILLGCLGEILNQRSGSLNLGVPGIMLLGAIGSLVGVFAYENGTADPNCLVCFLLSLSGCLGFSLLGGFIYAFLTITLKANQNVTGLTLTIFGNGVAKFLGGYLTNLAGGVGNVSLDVTTSVYRRRIPFLSDKLGIVSRLFFNYGFMVYLAIGIAIALHYFLEHSRMGLNLKGVGENPATADACGINVDRYKYFASILGSLISGLGGLYFIMDYVMGTWTTDGTIESLGWLAVALVIFVSWRPLRGVFGALLFGLSYWVYLYIPSFVSRFLLRVFHISNITHLQNIYRMIPYIVTLIVLIYVSKDKRAAHAPDSLGMNYYREDR